MMVETGGLEEIVKREGVEREENQDLSTNFPTTGREIS